MADSNQNTISNFLLGKGLTREQVAGILGNLKIESGYSPTAFNANEGAIGIAQWEGGRRTRLQAYAAQTGGTETSLTTQLGFLWQELTGPEVGALNSIALSTTPAAAATAFDQQFERSSGTSRTQRIAAANQVYSGVGPGAGQPGFNWNPTTGMANANGQAFRGQGSAFTTDGTVPQPGTWNALQNAGGFMDQNLNKAASDPVGTTKSILSGALGGMFSGLIQFLTPAMFVVGGIALVVVGLAVAAKPAVQKASSVAQTAAQAIPVK